MEHTMFRVRAAVIKGLTPHLLLTAAFLSFAEAKLAYASDGVPPHVELPTVDGPRVKYEWLNNVQVQAWHHRIDSAQANVGRITFEKPVEDDDEDEQLGVYTETPLSTLVAERVRLNRITILQDGVPVAKQPSASRETAVMATPTFPNTQGGIPAHGPSVFPTATGHQPAIGVPAGSLHRAPTAAGLAPGRSLHPAPMAT